MTTYAELIQQPPRYIKAAQIKKALAWDTDDHGVAIVDDPSSVSDADVFQYLYHHQDMTPAGKKLLEAINNDRYGGLIVRLQSEIANPRNAEAARPIWKILSNAAISQKGGAKTLLYSPQSMHSLYNTQSDIYDGYGVFKDFGWENSPSISRMWLNPSAKWKRWIPFNSKIEKALREKIYNTTANGVVFGPRQEDKLDLSDKEWYKKKNGYGGPSDLPDKDYGGMHYVAPALAAGAPLAVVGGMMSKKKPFMTGLGILGAAGLAGAAYGMAKDKGWKGFGPVESMTKYYDNAFRKQSSAEHGLPYAIDDTTPSAYLTELALGGFGKAAECPECLPYYPSSCPSDTGIY